MKIRNIFKKSLQLAAIASTAFALSGTVHASPEIPREIILEFKKNTVIEIAYASVKEGKQEQLQEYFSKVFPIAPEYGSQPLGIFPIAQSDSKGSALSTQPQMVGLFQWPDVEAFLRFHEDPRYIAAVPGRDKALSYLNNGNFYTVECDTKVTIREDRVYELLAALNDKSKYVSKLQRSERNKGKHTSVVLNKVPLSNVTQTSVHEACKIGGDHQYAPQTLTLNEWPGIEASQKSSMEKHRAYDSFLSLVGPYSFPPEN